MRAARVGVAALTLVALAGPAAAASPTPSPSPEDRSTTASVTPTAGPDRTTLVLRGFSDCAVIDGHLVFTTYDGKADNVVVRSTTTAYDYDREKYPYVVRLTVPATAAPGPAKVYAEPFCGPPEEYPPSSVVAFRVERSRLALRLRPRRPGSGDRLRIRAGTCDGAHGGLTVRVRDGGTSRDLRGVVDALGTVSLSVRVTAGGDVSLPLAARECRGSSYAGAVPFVVRTVAAEATPTPSLESPPAAPVPTPSGSASPTRGAVPTPTSATATASRRRAGSGRGWLVGLLAAGLVAATGLAAAALRRRGRPT